MFFFGTVPIPNMRVPEKKRPKLEVSVLHWHFIFLAKSLYADLNIKERMTIQKRKSIRKNATVALFCLEKKEESKST